MNARLLFIEVCTVLVRLYGPYNTLHQRCIIWTTQMCEHSADINALQPSINTGEFLAFITLLTTFFAPRSCHICFTSFFLEAHKLLHLPAGPLQALSAHLPADNSAQAANTEEILKQLRQMQEQVCFQSPASPKQPASPGHLLCKLLHALCAVLCCADVNKCCAPARKP